MPTNPVALYNGCKRVVDVTAVYNISVRMTFYSKILRLETTDAN